MRTSISEKTKKFHYLIALNPNCGFNCPTLLVKAINERDAEDIAISLGYRNFGKIKKVNY